MKFYIFEGKMDIYEAQVVKGEYLKGTITIRSLRKNEIIFCADSIVQTLDGFQTQNKRVLSDCRKIKDSSLLRLVTS